MPKKGYKQTKEHAKKIGDSNSGKTILEETRSKISESLKGKIHLGSFKKGFDARREKTQFKKGHTFSQKALKKMSNSRLGRKAWNRGLKGKEYKKHFKSGMKGCFTKGQVSPRKILEDKKVIKLYKENYHPLEISKEIGCCKGAIYSILKRNHINLRGHPIGEKSPHWLGGKSFEPYDKTFNNRFKRAIRKRDNQICTICGIHREKLKETLIVHHINYDKLLSIPQNCITLCRKCHSKTNYNRKHWIKFFQNLLTEKYDYKYSNQEIVLGVKE